MLMKTRFIILAALLLTSATSFAGGGHMMIHDAWVREAPPNAKMMAGYFSMMNHSGETRKLVGASSKQFKKVEIHKTINEGGVAKMKAQSSVEISTGATVDFKPGGLHLMLMNPKQPLKAGDKVELMLNFNDGEKVAVTAEVKKGMAGGEHHHEHMDHMEHMEHMQ
jgi:copper(I)-binding protein